MPPRRTVSQSRNSPSNRPSKSGFSVGPGAVVMIASILVVVHAAWWYQLTLPETRRKHNFSAGPAAMPLDVLKTLQGDLINFNNTGMGIAEVSARHPSSYHVLSTAEHLLRSLLNIPSSHSVLFMHGGAHAQFAAVPLHLVLGAHRGSYNVPVQATAQYVSTGHWCDRAAAEAVSLGVNVTISTIGFTKSPGDVLFVPLPSPPAYVYYVAAETIGGSEFPGALVLPPSYAGVPIVADYTSSFLTRAIDWASHDVVFASAGKNLGPPGVAVVVVRSDLIPPTRPVKPADVPSGTRAPLPIPGILSWHEHRALGMYNIAPLLVISFMVRMLESAEAFCVPRAYPPLFDKITASSPEDRATAGGSARVPPTGPTVCGVPALEEYSAQRAAVMYAAISQAGSSAECAYYVNDVPHRWRNRVSIPFRVRGRNCEREVDEDLEKRFLREAEASGILQVARHPKFGGCRATLYWSVPDSALVALVEFMVQFAASNPGI